MALVTSVVAKMVDILPVTPMMSTVAADLPASSPNLPVSSPDQAVQMPPIVDPPRMADLATDTTPAVTKRVAWAKRLP